MSNGQAVKVDFVPIILAALPLARDLVAMIIQGVEAMQADDITPEQIDQMMTVIEGKNADVQALVEVARRHRVAHATEPEPG